MPTCAGLDWGIQLDRPSAWNTADTREHITYNAKPVISSINAMSGNETRRSFRLPNVSMVQIAGPANTKFIAPKPKDARRAAVSLNPPCTKMFEE